MTRLFSSLLLILICSSAAAGAEKKAALPVEEGKTSYLSGGKKITVETFIPEGTEKRPAVLVLYGSGGSVLGKGEMVDFARHFAEQGAAVFLIHYFNRTGTLLVIRDGPIHRMQGVWTETVHDAVDFVAAHPRVRRGPVGIFGYSLGAYLAVSESSRDPRVGAVAELSGGIFDEVRGGLKRFPALLILHGRLDTRVPVKRGFYLEKTAEQFGAQPEIHIYEEEGHRLSKKALADVGQRAGLFLGRHLHF